MEISDIRRNSLIELAEQVSNTYCPQGKVSPELIASKAGITYNYGEYGNYFDGLLEHDSGEFHIFINTESVHTPDKARLRFSFAHELGHYFIEEHRKELMVGKSLHKSSSKRLLETEANCFASGLLMPSSRFIQAATSAGPFDFSVIELLAAQFGTSLSATLVRFIQTNIYPIMVIFSSNGKIKSRWMSPGFRYHNFRSKEISSKTITGQFFSEAVEYGDKEVVDASEWFELPEGMEGSKVYERCVYPTFNDTVMSVVWE